MGGPKKTQKQVEAWIQKRAVAIWTNLQTNHLWQRMLKNTLATTIAVILALTPAVVRVYGKAAYLAPITTVFGHPGRRFGMMAEALVLAIGGTMFGVGWSIFGLYLSSLIYEKNPPAAYTIKGIFLAFALMFHGFLRSHTPRLFIFVLLLIIVSVVSLTSPATAVSKILVTQIVYPIFTAAGMLLLVNTLVFPEFSSSFLGITTIETLGETVGALRDTGRYFIDMGKHLKVEEEELKSEEGTRRLERTSTLAEKPLTKSRTATDTPFFHKISTTFRKAKAVPEEEANIENEPVKLKSLTDSKAKLRAKLASCKAAQQECNFELAWGVLAPRDLKPISDNGMKLLVANTIALIGACESKYALMGDDDDKEATDCKDESQLDALAESTKIETTDDNEDSSRPVSRHGEADRETREERKKSKRRKKSRQTSKTRFRQEKENLELVKPRKEIEFGNIELLKYLVQRISKPLADLQEKIDRSVDVVTASLAYCYDVKKLPSGVFAPAGITLEEIDIRVDILKDSIVDFDRDSAFALESAAAVHDLESPQVDIMPRMETFLISSFILNLRQTALHILEMLKHSRVIVEKRHARNGRRRLYAPQINWRKWLVSGGEQDMLALPESGRKEARTGKKYNDAPDEDSNATSKETLLTKTDLESAPRSDQKSPELSPRAKPDAKKTVRKPAKDKGTFTYRFRNTLADSVEYLVGSDDFRYAIKLTVAVFLVTWPAFLVRWNTWYSLNRGLWAALQLVLITEVALGTSVMTFTLRGVGTTIGCIWGYAAYQAGNGNRYICVVFLVIGIVPSTYLQLGSKYVKVGQVSIISMTIVALATEDNTVPGSATENFLKRFIAFLIGGVVALIIEAVLFPVRARDRLVESLAGSIKQISEMEACLAHGIETEINVDVHSKIVAARFDRAKGKAEGALAAAETFLPFCANEPRLKGSFKGLALIYAEILYVLHAIVDRMDNHLHLRKEYGSGVLEELHAHIFPYRRNVAGSITLILFAVHEALTTKLPLPQFLPSARLAHLRMVNRVREVVLDKAPSDADNLTDGRNEIETMMVKRIVRQKFLSWNATSAGQVEVIEYLEELIDLVKLLVGANEFRSGMLTRPTYREYVGRIKRTPQGLDKDGNQALQDIEQAELRDVTPAPPNENNIRKTGLTKRRTTLTRKTELSKLHTEEEEQKLAEEELPMALQRVRTRRVEEMNSRLEKTRSREAEARREGKRVDRSH
jgi:hypothetical protein